MTPLAIPEVEQLLARDACAALIVAFAACNDAHDADGLAALFAPDGVLVRPGAAPLHGRAAIAHAYASRPSGRITRHVVSNVQVRLESATTATGLSYVTVWSGQLADAEGPFGRRADGRQAVGEFEDRFVRTNDGWRIAERRACFVMMREDAA